MYAAVSGLNVHFCTKLIFTLEHAKINSEQPRENIQHTTRDSMSTVARTASYL